MLNKHNLSIAAIASPEVTRYTLNAVYVTPNESVATDGMRLIVVSTVKPNGGELPGVKGVTASEDFAPFIMPAHVAKEIAALLPANNGAVVKSKKKNRRAPKPRKGEAVVDAVQNGHVTLGIPDSEGNERVFRIKPNGGQFPDHTKVVPDKSKAAVVVTVNIEMLIGLLQQMRQFAPKWSGGVRMVTLRLTDGNNPIRMDATNRETGQTMTAVLMPMRTEAD